MKTDKARMVFTDPPYNVVINGNVSGLGRIRHREFAMASGEMSVAQFIVFLVTVLRLLAAYSVDGSIHEIFIDWRHLHEILTAGRKVYTELKNLCVWVKTNAGLGSFFRSRHELVLVLTNGAVPHVNNVELGKHGRNRTNVWCYPGVNTMRAGRLEELAMHPTVKPVALSPTRSWTARAAVTSCSIALAALELHLSPRKKPLVERTSWKSILSTLT